MVARHVMSNRAVIVRHAAAGIGGLLLFASDYPLHAWPLQLVALVPWLWALSSGSDDRSERRPTLSFALLGLTFGASYALPLLVVTAFPWLMALALGAYIIAIWAGASIVVARVLRWTGLSGAIAVGSAIVVAEWISTQAVPIWGTAQSFVRVWSAAPWAIQFVDVTGTPGIVFVLATSQVLLLRIVLDRHRLRFAAALASLLLTVAVYDLIRWFERPTGAIRVAAVGWVHEQLPQGLGTPTGQLVADVMLPLFQRAVDQGATLIVSPETGFFVDGPSRDAAFEPFRGFARTHGVSLAIGYFDDTRNDNRIALIDASGERHEEYRKTHLIPLLEDYVAGDGTPVVFPVGSVRAGGMICQDDNFIDIASKYGRLCVPIVVIPTNDWLAVKDYHFENSRMRALENRFAIVRAATNGVSAIVSAKGEVVARADHFETGPSFVVGDVPLLDAGSVFAWLRHGFVALCLAFLAAAWGLERRKATLG